MKVKTALVILSAGAEWRIATHFFASCQPQPAKYNSWFELELNGARVVFFHGGWGKISAAASTQYAVDRWQPDLLINIGTCGGFSGFIEQGEIVLADETIIYDIYERMKNAQDAIDYYSTRIDLSYLQEPYPLAVRRMRLISADRDIDPAEVSFLQEQYHAGAADWESGAIAWVAAKNGVRCLILRGVSDLVDQTGGEAYGNYQLFIERTKGIITRLLESLPE